MRFVRASSLLLPREIYQCLIVITLCGRPYTDWGDWVFLHVRDDSLNAPQLVARRVPDSCCQWSSCGRTSWARHPILAFWVESWLIVLGNERWKEDLSYRNTLPLGSLIWLLGTVMVAGHPLSSHVHGLKNVDKIVVGPLVNILPMNEW